MVTVETHMIIKHQVTSHKKIQNKNQACLVSSLVPRKITRMIQQVFQDYQVEKLVKMINGVPKYILRLLMHKFQNLLLICLNLNQNKLQPTIQPRICSVQDLVPSSTQSKLRLSLMTEKRKKKQMEITILSELKLWKMTLIKMSLHIIS